VSCHVKSPSIDDHAGNCPPLPAINATGIDSACATCIGAHQSMHIAERSVASKAAKLANLSGG
jgi:hypothetical protein